MKKMPFCKTHTPLNSFLMGGANLVWQLLILVGGVSLNYNAYFGKKTAKISPKLGQTMPYTLLIEKVR